MKKRVRNALVTFSVTPATPVVIVHPCRACDGKGFKLRYVCAVGDSTRGPATVFDDCAACGKTGRAAAGGAE